MPSSARRRAARSCGGARPPVGKEGCGTRDGTRVAGGNLCAPHPVLLVGRPRRGHHAHTCPPVAWRTLMCVGTPARPWVHPPVFLCARLSLSTNGASHLRVRRRLTRSSRGCSWCRTARSRLARCASPFTPTSTRASATFPRMPPRCPPPRLGCVGPRPRRVHPRLGRASGSVPLSLHVPCVRTEPRTLHGA